MSKSVKTPHAVIAAAREDAHFRAVEVHNHDGRIEVVWARSVAEEGRSWGDFAAQCGLNSSAETHKSSRKGPVAVVGLDPTAVAFYKISAPAVGDEETDSIVRMQAESLLPLSPDQIEVAWRKLPSTDGKIDITLAAARTDYLHRFAESVRAFRPRNILVSFEATAKVWHRLFSEGERQAAVMSIGQRHSQLCLVQNGVVTHAAMVDTGMADLMPAVENLDEREPSDVLERFAQDTRTVLESFGWVASNPWPVCVLSGGSAIIERLVDALNDAGLAARPSLPREARLRVPSEFDLSDIYEYRVPLGLALMELDGTAGALDLLERIDEDEQKRRTRSTWRSTVLAGVVAALMLIALLVTAYLVDRAREKQLSTLVNQPEFGQASQQQVLLKTVARHRADLLQLLTDMNAGESNGIVLDSFRFKKGQPVTISGQAGNEEQMWKFQAGLRGQKNIEDVEISTAVPDKKTKKIKFTMSFQYKSFTKKNAVL